MSRCYACYTPPATFELFGTLLLRTQQQQQTMRAMRAMIATTAPTPIPIQTPTARPVAATSADAAVAENTSAAAPVWVMTLMVGAASAVTPNLEETCAARARGFGPGCALCCVFVRQGVF